MTEKLQPKLRFRGFTDPWEQRQLGEVFVANNERNVIGLPFMFMISVSTMSYKAEGNGAAESSLSSYKVLREGDVAFEGHSNKRNRYGRLIVNDLGIGLMSPRFTALRPVHSINTKFFKSYMSYEQLMRPILIRSTKAGRLMNELVVEDLKNEVLKLPTDEEQTQIGLFFQKIDFLISLHERKLELLKKKKQAYLQQIFNQKLRFKGFTEPWEPRKASTLFKEISDKGYPDLPVLAATQDKGMIIREQMDKDIHHDRTKENTYKKVTAGQFVIHLRSFQGGFAHSNIDGITSPAYTIFDFCDKENQNDMFWKYIFTSQSFIKQLVRVTYGIRDGRSISFKEFLQNSFIIPGSYIEQKKIALFLLKLDSRISLHEYKISLLKQKKQAYLQQIFV